MWQAIARLFAWLIGKRREDRQETRADFEAIGRQWETLANMLHGQLRPAYERISHLEREVAELREKWLECEKRHDEDRRKLLRLEKETRRTNARIDLLDQHGGSVFNPEAE